MLAGGWSLVPLRAVPDAEGLQPVLHAVLHGAHACHNILGSFVCFVCLFCVGGLASSRAQRPPRHYHTIQSLLSAAALALGVATMRTMLRIANRRMV